ncbi:MAG: hypothetical protein F4X65_00650 [Chloroflexi bacterium]|nr:hypothetical protein [Chloroflexota bacterium]
MDRTTIVIVGAIGGAVVLSVGIVIVSAFRPLSTLETALWQLITLAAGLYGSYLLGQKAARESATDLLRLHARSAVRRLLAIRGSWHRLSHRIEEFQVEERDPRLDVIQAIVEERSTIADSAIEDWRDIAADEVDEVITLYERSSRSHHAEGEG